MSKCSSQTQKIRTEEKKNSLYLPKESSVQSEQSVNANRYNRRMAKARSVDRQKPQRMTNKTETLDTRTTTAGTLDTKVLRQTGKL